MEHTDEVTIDNVEYEVTFTISSSKEIFGVLTEIEITKILPDPRSWEIEAAIQTVLEKRLDDGLYDPEKDSFDEDEYYNSRQR